MYEELRSSVPDQNSPGRQILEQTYFPIELKSEDTLPLLIALKRSF